MALYPPPYSENLGCVEEGVVSAEGWSVVLKLGVVHWAGWWVGTCANHVNVNQPLLGSSRNWKMSGTWA